jgi:hypothetical protein
LIANASNLIHGATGTIVLVGDSGFHPKGSYSNDMKDFYGIKVSFGATKYQFTSIFATRRFFIES